MHLQYLLKKNIFRVIVLKTQGMLEFLRPLRRQIGFIESKRRKFAGGGVLPFLIFCSAANSKVFISAVPLFLYFSPDFLHFLSSSSFIPLMKRIEDDF